MIKHDRSPRISLEGGYEKLDQLHSRTNLLRFHVFLICTYFINKNSSSPLGLILLFLFSFYNLKIGMVGCRHSSVDSSAPTILPPWARVPRTPYMLFSFLVFVLYLSCEKNENKQKETGFGPCLKKYWHGPPIHTKKNSSVARCWNKK